MAIIVDPYTLLQTIGRNQNAFAAIRADASKAGQKLFEKQIKHKSTGVETLSAIYKAFGDDDFKIMIDGVDKLAATIKRLDKNNPAVKTMNARDCRVHLIDLAAGRITPLVKPEKKKKESKTKSNFMKSEGLKLKVRDRENE